MEKETADSRSKVKLSPGLEEGDHALQEWDETLATESVREAPELRERREGHYRVHGCPGTMDRAPALRPPLPSGCCVRMNGSDASGPRTHQDPRLLFLRRVEVLFPQFLHHRLPLLQGQPHLLTSPLLTLFHGSSSVAWIGVDSSVRQRCDLE
jgi:hypothetical protein